MKRLLCLSLLWALATPGFSQNSIFSLYGGAGSSINYNYDAGVSAGFSFIKVGKNSRTGIGAQLFYQGYAFLYDNEANGMHNGKGSAGVTILDKVSYIFVTPKISQFLDKKQQLEAYLNVGGGFKMSGTETMRKWDHSLNYSPADYDSVINSSNNINSMLLRVGIGLNEYAHMGKGNWWFVFSQDIGFLTASITKSSDVTDPSRTQYSPAHKLNPVYFSFQIGIGHSKTRY